MNQIQRYLAGDAVPLWELPNIAKQLSARMYWAEQRNDHERRKSLNRVRREIFERWQQLFGTPALDRLMNQCDAEIATHRQREIQRIQGN